MDPTELILYREISDEKAQLPRLIKRKPHKTLHFKDGDCGLTRMNHVFSVMEAHDLRPWRIYMSPRHAPFPKTPSDREVSAEEKSCGVAEILWDAMIVRDESIPVDRFILVSKDCGHPKCFMIVRHLPDEAFSTDAMYNIPGKPGEPIYEIVRHLNIVLNLVGEIQDDPDGNKRIRKGVRDLVKMAIALHEEKNSGK